MLRLQQEEQRFNLEQKYRFRREIHGALQSFLPVLQVRGKAAASGLAETRDFLLLLFGGVKHVYFVVLCACSNTICYTDLTSGSK